MRSERRRVCRLAGLWDLVSGDRTACPVQRTDVCGRDAGRLFPCLQVPPGRDGAGSCPGSSLVHRHVRFLLLTPAVWRRGPGTGPYGAAQAAPGSSGPRGHSRGPVLHLGCSLSRLRDEAGAMRCRRAAPVGCAETSPVPPQRLHGRSDSAVLPLPPHCRHSAVGPDTVTSPVPLHAEHVRRVCRCLPLPPQDAQATVGPGTRTVLRP